MEYKSEKDTVIITDLDYLSKPCEPIDIDEGKELAERLFRVTTDKQNGIGLAANQIGINKRVCVLNVKEPLYFINPRYEPVEESGKFVYLETCLSIPDRLIRTERWRQIKITADNIGAGSVYDVSNIPLKYVMESMDTFEMAVIQHEIDHLDGITIIDRMYHPMPISVEKMYSRNDKIQIQKGKEIIEIKYKKFADFEKSGWKIVAQGVLNDKL
jgi:peptide deformylase